ERERAGRGKHIVVSMTHNAHRLAEHRLHGEPERTLTGGLACYRVYATADGRYLTITPVEPKFWRRLCELIGREDLVERQYEEDRDARAGGPGGAFRPGGRAAGPALFEGEDVMAGPVAPRAEARASFEGCPPPMPRTIFPT